MDRLDAMAAFVATIDEGSLAAAARRLGYAPAAVTRAITLLEDRVGAQLLHRTTRALHLTRLGEAYLAMCRQVLAEITQAEQGAAAEQDMPRGVLTVTAPVLFGRLHVRPVLDRFLDANPAVQARLVLLDRVVSLIDEGSMSRYGWHICRIPASSPRSSAKFDVFCAQHPLILRNTAFRRCQVTWASTRASCRTIPRRSLGASLRGLKDVVAGCRVSPYGRG